MDYRISIIIIICAVSGFILHGEMIPTEAEIIKEMTMTFEHERENSSNFITILGGSHNIFYLTRTYDNTTKIETYTIRNDGPEHLTMYLKEQGDEPRAFTLEFPPYNDYVIIAYSEFFLGFAAIILTGGLVIFWIRAKPEPEIEPDSSNDKEKEFWESISN